ncbi:MAG: glycosyltransferase [Candidatus Beckwithbacteria bacterium]|nr:glycosyltransferase [Patescibacteria group bacterium]
MKVSIIIANHRFDELFKETVKSVLEYIRVTNSYVEIIVVSNGMGLSKASEVEEWLKNKNVKLLQIQEGNPSKARNIGARVARGKYLVFLDNDTELGEGLDAVVKYLDKHLKVGAGQLKLLRMQEHMLVRNQYVFDSAGEMVTRNGFLVERARGAKDNGQFDKDDLIFSGKGAGMVVRKEVFEKVGGFDEDYIYYWEEPDLLWRVWKSGYEVKFLWMGTVYHAYGTDKKPIPKIPFENQVYLACRNQIITIYKNGVGFHRWRMLMWVNLSWLGLEVLFLVRGKWKQAWAIERAWGWLIFRSGAVMRKRRWVLKNLPSDDGWMEKVMVKRGLGWYIGKGLSYILGKPF